MRVQRASGNKLLDTEGREWLDMQSGILNTPLGHGSDPVIRALSQVIDSGLINTYDRTPNHTVQLLEMMEEYHPGFTWYPFNTGAEAVEKAIQLVATHVNSEPAVAVLPGSFHGKLMSMAWASYRDKLPWGNLLNLRAINPNDGDSVIPLFDALIYEPIQGWDGTINDEERLAELCYRRGALLIADEMITGFYRCGKRFMSEKADIILCGKGISGGAPLSLMGVRKASHLPKTIPVGWRSTGAGNNLSCTIALHVLKHLMFAEHHHLYQIGQIESALHDMGFEVLQGALGFKTLRDFDKTKNIFEERRIIASWHCPPYVRVGPSFITTIGELDRMRFAFNEVGEL